MTPDLVRAGKCKEINTMIEHGVFEPIAPGDVEPGWAWLTTRWENQQRSDSEVRCRYVAREFKTMDPYREGLFTPSSTNTTSRLIDFKAVQFGQPTAVLGAVCAYFHAVQGGDVRACPCIGYIKT